jgi:hypothetical protein
MDECGRRWIDRWVLGKKPAVYLILFLPKYLMKTAPCRAELSTTDGGVAGLVFMRSAWLVTTPARELSRVLCALQQSYREYYLL